MSFGSVTAHPSINSLMESSWTAPKAGPVLDEHKKRWTNSQQNSPGPKKTLEGKYGLSHSFDVVPEFILNT